MSRKAVGQPGLTHPGSLDVIEISAEDAKRHSSVTGMPYDAVGPSVDESMVAEKGEFEAEKPTQRPVATQTNQSTEAGEEVSDNEGWCDREAADGCSSPPNECRGDKVGNGVRRVVR